MNTDIDNNLLVKSEDDEYCIYLKDATSMNFNRIQEKERDDKMIISSEEEMPDSVK